MESAGSAPVKELLLRWKAGDRAGLDQADPLGDGELGRITHRAMRSQRAGHTLPTTALANQSRWTRVYSPAMSESLLVVDEALCTWHSRACLAKAWLRSELEGSSRDESRTTEENR